MHSCDLSFDLGGQVLGFVTLTSYLVISWVWEQVIEQVFRH